MPNEMINLTIDGQSVNVPKGTTILQAAEQIGIHIPAVCYHPHLTANGLCRVCSVDTGWRVQAAACVTECTEGMVVNTQSEDVVRARKTILEMMANTVDLQHAPDLIIMLEQYDADPARFPNGSKRQMPVYDDNPFYIRDYNQCINCWRCVQVCADDAQFAYALSFNGRGFNTTIGTFMGDGMLDTTCVFCGQCVGVCPTGALTPKREALLDEGMNPDEIFFATRGKRRGKKNKQVETPEN